MLPSDFLYVRLIQMFVALLDGLMSTFGYSVDSRSLFFTVMASFKKFTEFLTSGLVRGMQMILQLKK
jgi:hypothetical protein